MIKKVKKQNQNKINVASHWILPLPMWLSKVYIVHKAAHTSMQEDLGRGRWETLQLALGPFPLKEEQEARQPAAQSGASGSPANHWHISVVVEGSFQLVSYSFVAVCMIWDHCAASAKLGPLIFFVIKSFHVRQWTGPVGSCDINPWCALKQ